MRQVSHCQTYGKRLVRPVGSRLRVQIASSRLSPLGGNATARRRGAGHLAAVVYDPIQIELSVVEIRDDAAILDIRLPADAALEELPDELA